MVSGAPLAAGVKGAGVDADLVGKDEPDAGVCVEGTFSSSVEGVVTMTAGTAAVDGGAAEALLSDEEAAMACSERSRERATRLPRAVLLA